MTMSFLRFPGRACHAATALALALLLAAPGAFAAGIAIQVVDQQGAPLPDAAVYAMPASGKALPAPPGAKATIDQIDREFVPMVSIMQTGTSVSFPNKDDVEHDVYSFSPAKRFEIRLYSGVPSKPIVFDKPGLITMGCNIHDSMVAYVIVVDTPYFAKTDGAGRAVLQGLPAGAYRISAWHHTMHDPNAQPEQPAQAGADGGGPAMKFVLTTDKN